MNEKPKIPIKNIYYMLCYAWNVLEYTDEINLGSEPFDNVYNLFARIYLNGTSSLIKRGLNRYYISNDEEISSVRGKINLSESIKRQTLYKGKMVCRYDVFSQDIKLNQIVKRTIDILIRAPELNNDLRYKLKKVKYYFSNVKDIKFSKSVFSTLRYNRNNYHYRMLINIGELIYEGLIVNEEGTDFIFSDFIRDRQMAKLYEKFVLNFYKRYLDKKFYQVHSPKIKWSIDSFEKNCNLSLLPEMRTDVVVENIKENNQLIIDTKYYAQTLVASNWSNIEKVRTSHLYQLFAYVNNSTFDGVVSGMLLYPTIEEELNVKYSISGKSMIISTLNLNSEWKDIEMRLLSFID
ncbi:5-methylcytosine-specific restriction endonuclease system specificity protein McrC [Vallitalea guaymasensis]|uniref:5-methylcytosine-specific restriction endonuclease system specificity protein McrC n=1 Tax=Vallitalea guaymasensis TaxID=1185412 RepID=UPI0023539F90|nr:5-methylcytosine-specific restriction endonuclease system specificity protein McrC [Vallitalea guaymasensis]